MEFYSRAGRLDLTDSPEPVLTSFHDQDPEKERPVSEDKMTKNRIQITKKGESLVEVTKGVTFLPRTSPPLGPCLTAFPSTHLSQQYLVAGSEVGHHYQ